MLSYTSRTIIKPQTNQVLDLIYMSGEATHYAGYEIHDYRGNKEFSESIQNLDFGGHTEPEYNHAKLMVLASMVYDEPKYIAGVLLNGHILLEGIRNVIKNGWKHPYPELPCEALTYLGLDLDSYEEFYRKNRTQIEALRPVIEILGKLRYDFGEQH